MQIESSVIIVTGAGSGIGQAIATELACHGARVVCVGRRPERLASTVKQIQQAGGQALAVAADVTDQQQVDAMAKQVLDTFGQIDVLFNNAGSFNALGGIWEVDPDAWWHDVTVNLRGPMLCARAVLPHMMQRQSGVIIHMLGGDKIPGGTGYSCSKVAIRRLIELQAGELQRVGSPVMVFGMAPGFVHTEMTDVQITSPKGQFWLPSSAKAVEEGRNRSPRDCAQATVRLLQNAQPRWSGLCFGVNSRFDGTDHPE